jgi:hypothetical protein
MIISHWPITIIGPGGVVRVKYSLSLFCTVHLFMFMGGELEENLNSAHSCVLKY